MIKCFLFVCLFVFLTSIFAIFMIHQRIRESENCLSWNVLKKPTPLQSTGASTVMSSCSELGPARPWMYPRMGHPHVSKDGASTWMYPRMGHLDNLFLCLTTLSDLPGTSFSTSWTDLALSVYLHGRVMPSLGSFLWLSSRCAPKGPYLFGRHYSFLHLCLEACWGTQMHKPRQVLVKVGKIFFSKDLQARDNNRDRDKQ